MVDTEKLEEGELASQGNQKKEQHCGEKMVHFVREMVL
jgi:hypothetical protein